MPPRPLRPIVDEYAAKKLRRCSQNTKNKYLYALDHWQDMVGHEPSTDDLFDEAVEIYQDSLIELHGLTEETAKSYVAKILALWRFCHRMRYVQEWPMVEVVVPAEHIPTAWSREQLSILFAALREQTGFIGGVQAAEWWTALHWVLWDSLERISAVLALPFENVNLADRHLWFAAKTRKGKTRDKPHQLRAATVAALSKICEPRRELVFPFPFNRGTLWNRYRRILLDAGLPHGRDSMFHRMRRSGASHMMAAGENPSQTLDHADPMTAKRHYIDPRIAPPVSPSTILFDPTRPKDQGDPPRAA